MEPSALDQTSSSQGPIQKKLGQRGILLSLLAGDFVRVGILLLIFQVFALQLSVVRGSSMLPNIHDGDRLLVDKYSYALTDIQRFDVVILACPVNKGVDYVKRVVGMPGDRIVLDQGKLIVNGRELPEEFGFVPDHNSFGLWVVPEGQYFVLGDNRPVSSDSREGWFVKKALIKGKVRACIWPPTSLKVF